MPRRIMVLSERQFDALRQARIVPMVNGGA
jgi:hypothetical protein